MHEVSGSPIFKEQGGGLSPLRQASVHQDVICLPLNEALIYPLLFFCKKKTVHWLLKDERPQPSLLVHLGS